MKLLIKIIVLFSVSFNANSQSWENIGGINDNVYDMINFEGELFVGGRFTHKVKSWNGSSWTNYSSLFGIASPLTFSIYKDTLYTGGDFPYQGSQSKVYRLVNGSWEEVGGVFDESYWSSTKKLITFDSLLISGGRFNSIGGLPINNIAAWNGSTWSSMGQGLNNMVLFLEVYNNSLFATGDFTASGTDTNVRKIARWSGSNWECFDTNIVFTSPYALKSYEGGLLIGNVWNNIDGIDMKGIARWDGTNYASMGDTIIKKVHQFLEFNDDLYICADLYSEIPWIYERAVLRWNGNSWDIVGEKFNEWVMCIEGFENMLYVGGQFSSPVAHIGRINPLVGLNEINPDNKTIVRIIDLMGRDVLDNSNTYMIYMYDDGTSEKVFRFE